MSPAPIRLLPHVSVLKERYAAWLCDVWGVVHNGVRPFASAVDALIRFRDGGGCVILLTNAPRRSSAVLRQLARIGVPEAAFDAVVTSGDATRDWLRQLGARSIVHIGPERDRSLFDDLDLNLTDADRAEVALCTGLDDDELQSVADYQPLLGRLARRGVRLMCANPDLVVDRDGTLVPCAGALARAYQQMGGEALFTGKPHRPIYDLAMARLGGLMDRSPRPAEILAIGDGLETDIAGAAGAGLDCLFIIGGIHTGEVADDGAEIDAARLVARLADPSRPPVAAQRQLTW
jgi:HAD superfamily hydrolase (TIGR01459 family)